jgi:universal stress protein E
MRKCPCPVWVVKPGQSAPYSKILAAVDPLQEPSNDPFNAKIMELATSMASRDHAALHIVHAWDVDGNDLDTIRSELSVQQRETILQKHQRKHQSALRDLLAGYPLSEIKHQIHLPRERPEQAIGQIAEQEGIDLIVMGTVARTGVPGFLIGNAAESVLSSVKCGMLTVKPDGFETPVSLPEQIITGNQESHTSRPETRRIA